MGKKERFNDAFNYLKENGLAHTQKDVAETMGSTSPNVSSALKGIESVLTDNFLRRFDEAYKNIFNIDWLLSGDGDMLAPLSSAPAPDPTGKDYRLVPLINIDSVGGLHSWPEVTDETQYREKYIPFSGARDDDYCIRESGSSMVPSIPPGSILLIRNVPNWAEYFGYGAVYVLELTDGRRITKEIRKSEVDAHLNVLCHSFNDTVADEELPKSLIRSVWKVIKVLTTYGF